MSTSTFDRFIETVGAGATLPPDAIRELSRTPDVLPIGMLADTLRRRLHGTTVTFLRVAACPFDQSFANAVLPAAREIRVTGAPETLAIAKTAIRTAKEVAGDRTVAAFSWADVERLVEGAVRSSTRGNGANALIAPVALCSSPTRSIRASRASQGA